MHSKKYIDDNIKFRILEAPLMDENMDTKIWISKIWKI